MAPLFLCVRYSQAWKFAGFPLPPRSFNVFSSPVRVLHPLLIQRHSQRPAAILPLSEPLVHQASVTAFLPPAMFTLFLDLAHRRFFLPPSVFLPPHWSPPDRYASPPTSAGHPSSCFHFPSVLPNHSDPSNTTVSFLVFSLFYPPFSRISPMMASRGRRKTSVPERPSPEDPTRFSQSERKVSDMNSVTAFFALF